MSTYTVTVAPTIGLNVSASETINSIVVYGPKPSASD
jgi:hypothetical protein